MAELVNITSATVRLGERDFVVTEAPRIRSRVWKERFMAEVNPLFSKISGAKDMPLNGPEDILALLPVFESLFTSGFDTIFDLFLAYSPDLEADKEYIEQNATDRQIFAGFSEVVRLADPFGMVALLRTQIGRRAAQTSSNSVSANGA